VTQPDDKQIPAGAPAKPDQPAEHNPAAGDLEAPKTVSDANANLVKGGVKKTMSTQV
jgi:hypothetical protein